MNESAHILTCREGFEQALATESGGRFDPAQPGMVLLETTPPAAPFIFERQRMIAAQSLSAEATRPLALQTARDMLAPILAEDTLWTTHAWSADPDMLSRVQGLEKALLQHAKKIDTGTWKCWRKPEKLAARNTGFALQLFRSGEQVWHSVSPIEQLPDPYPGGIRRMKMDPDSPSRSYLKMEEALSYLDEEPQPGQRVVDLGAAPGGWSWSFLKRGCEVTSVDNGPMKIEQPEAFGGSLTHVRADGITYLPETPVDWMVCDMLIPPGQVIGMLRKWIDQGMTTRLIFNVKLPQQEAYEGLRPLAEYLETATNGGLRIKQLYHDRREVTAFGVLNACSE